MWINIDLSSITTSLPLAGSESKQVVLIVYDFAYKVHIIKDNRFEGDATTLHLAICQSILSLAKYRYIAKA